MPKILETPMVATLVQPVIPTVSQQLTVFMLLLPAGTPITHSIWVQHRFRLVLQLFAGMLQELPRLTTVPERLFRITPKFIQSKRARIMEKSWFSATKVLRINTLRLTKIPTQNLKQSIT